MLCTHHLLPHHVSHTALSHTIFHTQLCHTLSFTHNFHTHTHTIFHTQLCHPVFLCHTLSFTYHFATHNSSHTTCFTSRSSITSFVFPFFPVPPTTFVGHYWKKLTCGVIRSFNFRCSFEIRVWSCNCRRRCALSIVFCNSVSADCIVVAASRLLGAAAACVILLSFAAGSRN